VCELGGSMTEQQVLSLTRLGWRLQGCEQDPTSEQIQRAEASIATFFSAYGTVQAVVLRSAAGPAYSHQRLLGSAPLAAMEDTRTLMKR
jgi:hypothetical protein